MTRRDFVDAIGHSGYPAIPLRDVLRFVDEAVNEFHQEERWPWRVTGTLGPVPLTVANLGPIELVTTGTGRIYPREHSDIMGAGIDQAEIGSPLFYYVSGELLQTWPVSPLDVGVTHYTNVSWSSGGQAAATDADTPTAPVRWHDLILLLVQERAARYLRDFDGAKVLRADYAERLAQARESELYRRDTELRPQRGNA